MKSSTLCKHRLQLPKGGLGRSYIIIQLYIDNTGPYDFMVDSGLTTELITPHLQSILHLKNAGITKQGLSAGEIGKTQSLVELNNASLCCNSVGRYDKFPLPPLTAIVTDFPQEHMDPRYNWICCLIPMLYNVLSSLISHFAPLFLVNITDKA